MLDSYYEGDVVNGVKQGVGTLYHACCMVLYEGEWNCDYIEGMVS